MTKPRLFALGDVVSTPKARSFAEKHQIDLLNLLARHQTGDLCEADLESNEAALITDSRILSSYQIGSDKVWVITEADRTVTTILLPSDY